MIERNHKIQNLIHHLRKVVLSSCAPGERLPSKRELAVTHGVSTMTVQRALCALRRDKLVFSRPGAGWFRRSNRSSAIRKRSPRPRVGLISYRTRDEWPRNDIYAVIEAEARTRKIELIPVPNARRQRATRARSQIDLSTVPWNTFDVGLLVEAEDTLTQNDPILRRRRVIAVEADATRQGIDSVVFADAEAGALAARHLFELGHRFFSVTDEISIPELARDPNSTARRLGFESALSELGGVIMPEWRVACPRRMIHESSFSDFAAQTVRRWAKLPQKVRPTALFCLVPEMLPPLINGLADHDMQVPRDLSVITVTWNQVCYGGQPAVLNGQSLTSVDMELSRLVRLVFDLAEERAADPEEKHRERSPGLLKAGVSLRQGQTTIARPPSNPVLLGETLRHFASQI
jgi:DNA-binding LacI/PurR family transcriptional regulator